MSDSPARPSSSGAKASYRYRICGSCNRFLPKVEKDPHELCVKCRGCSRSHTCPVCSSWTEEQWVIASQPSKRQQAKLKQKVSPLDCHAMSSSGELTSPPHDNQGETHFASLSSVKHMQNQIEGLMTMMSAMAQKMNVSVPSSVDSRESTEEGNVCNPSLFPVGQSSGDGSSVAPGETRSSHRESPPPPKKARKELRKASRWEDVKDYRSSGGRRDGDDAPDDRRAKDERTPVKKGVKRDRKGRPTSSVPSLEDTPPKGHEGSRLETPSASGVSIMASGALVTPLNARDSGTESDTGHTVIQKTRGRKRQASGPPSRSPDLSPRDHTVSKDSAQDSRILVVPENRRSRN